MTHQDVGNYSLVSYFSQFNWLNPPLISDLQTDLTLRNPQRHPHFCILAVCILSCLLWTSITLEAFALSPSSEPLIIWITLDKEEWINIELKCMTEMWKKKGGKLKTVGLLELFFFSFQCLLVKSSGETWPNRIWIEVVLYPNFLSKTETEKNIKIDLKRLIAATVPRFPEIQYHAIYC